MSDPSIAPLRDDISRVFAGLKDRVDGIDGDDDRYPGSRHVRRAVIEEQAAPKADEPDWERLAQTYTINGRSTQLFPIGALAEALHRSPTTLRAWERKGFLPETSFRARGGKSPRLYTREQIEGLVTLARQEGLLDRAPARDGTIGKGKRTIERTRFAERAHLLFKRLKAVR